MTDTATYDLMAAAAEAVGKSFLIGVRGHNRSWFAHCDDVEFDGSNPDEAVRAVIRGLLGRAAGEARSAKATQSIAERQIAALPELSDPPEDPDGG